MVIKRIKGKLRFFNLF